MPPPPSFQTRLDSNPSPSCTAATTFCQTVKFCLAIAVVPNLVYSDSLTQAFGSFPLQSGLSPLEAQGRSVWIKPPYLTITEDLFNAVRIYFIQCTFWYPLLPKQGTGWIYTLLKPPFYLLTFKCFLKRTQWLLDRLCGVSVPLSHPQKGVKLKMLWKM